MVAPAAVQSLKMSRWRRHSRRQGQPLGGSEVIPVKPFGVKMDGENFDRFAAIAISFATVKVKIAEP